MSEMYIAGFLPVSLIDYPGKISSVVFTHGCNLRCRYCHNPELVIKNPLDNKLDDFFKHLQGKDIEGVAVTGGEPLVSCGLFSFLEYIKNDGYCVKLDTNGSLPSKLREVLKAGFADFVSVDVKAFIDEDMSYVTRTSYPLEKLFETIEVLKEHGVEYELRHTLWKVPDRGEVDNVLSKIHGDKLSVQFPLSKGVWLDRRFNINFSDDEVLAVRQIFDKYGAVYRNLPE